VRAGPGQGGLQAIRSSLSGEAGGSLARDVVATMGNRILLIGIGLVTSVIVARTLGPSGRGIYAVAVALTAICVQFGNLGLHASNTWAVARRPDLLGTLIANSLLVSAALGGGIAIVVLLVTAAFPDLIVLPTAVLTLALLAIPANLAYLLLQNLLLGTQRIRYFNGVELLNRVVIVVAFAAAIWLGIVSPEVAVGAGLVAAVVTTALAGVVLVRSAGRSIAPRLAILVENSRYGFRAYAAALFSFLVIRADLLLVNYFRGPTDTGYYSIAVSLADLVYLPPVVIGSMLFPRLAAMKDSTERRALTNASLIVTAGGMLLAVVAAALLSEFGVRLLFGAEFEPAVPAFLWLLPGILTLSIYTILANYFAATGLPIVAVLGPLAGLGADVVLNLVLIPAMGFVGASIASSVAYALMLVMGLTTYLKFDRGLHDE
jgi:O-antigen/teichoic acid export membrane protein